MTGKEGKNVPAGSLELDPASLPSSHAGVDVSENLGIVSGQNHLNESCSKLQEDIQERNNESRESVSPTKFLEKKEKSEEKDSSVDNVDLHSQNPGSKGNVTATNVMEPIIVSDGSETSSEELGLKAKYERNSSLGHAGVGHRGKSSCNGSVSFAEDIVGSPLSATEVFAVPDPVFYDFDAERSLKKFEVGQIWALYSDEDALPKYYGRVQKIDSSYGFQLQLIWLVSCSPSKGIIPWKDQRMPICCGKFNLGKRHKCESIAVFSHLVREESIDGKHIYSFFPQTGDVWALYKDWSAEIKCSDLENCQYLIVEVMTQNDSEITVRVLEQVVGFKSVFKPQMDGRLTVTMEIPSAELLRFSHQIPAFCLTEEKYGSLRGFLELDPAGMPLHYF